MMQRIVDEARYVGTEAVDGTATHVVAVDDFGDLAREFGAVPAEADGEFDIETGTFYIGTADHRMHRMTMEGTLANEGPHLADQARHPPDGLSHGRRLHDAVPPSDEYAGHGEPDI